MPGVPLGIHGVILIEDERPQSRHNVEYMSLEYRVWSFGLRGLGVLGANGGVRPKRIREISNPKREEKAF
ncbi:hypothetical protein M1N87_01545 [Dehalococcoidia bacterium]|nr:hypothetical protein [Dehalococcoidia bacterium]